MNHTGLHGERCGTTTKGDPRGYAAGLKARVRQQVLPGDERGVKDKSHDDRYTRALLDILNHPTQRRGRSICRYRVLHIELQDRNYFFKVGFAAIIHQVTCCGIDNKTTLFPIVQVTGVAGTKLCHLILTSGSFCINTHVYSLTRCTVDFSNQ